jgi:hypothetical protein
MRALLATCYHAGFLLGLFFDPEDGGDVPPKRRLTFNRLHGIISQKTVFFITTAVRTSNPTQNSFRIMYNNSVCTRYVSTTKPNRLMLFRETVAVYCENHTEHINTLYGHNAEL